MSLDTSAGTSAARGGPTIGTLRKLLLALVLVGAAGLTVELVTLEHTASTAQWLPIAALVLAVVSSVALWLRPTHRAVRAHQALMVLLLALGAVGLFLHFQGNLAFELEIEPETRGLTLLIRALYGAVPALAPGALIELSLLGLVQTWGHPALGSRARAPDGSRTPSS